MRVCHNVSVDFDDPNLVSAAGLVPVMALAEKAGLYDLVTEHVRVPGSAGANAAVKVASLLAGMATGQSSIADMDLVRHGGLGKLFTGSRGPDHVGHSPAGVRLRSRPSAGRGRLRLLVNLAGQVPALLGGAGQVAYVDIDDTIRATHGYAKQGVGYGYSKVKGLNVQVATVSTPRAAPVIVGTRLRKGNAASAHGGPRLVSDALSTAKKAGATGMVTVRADSAYYNHAVVAATARAGAYFSVTARMDPGVTAAITGIPDQAWVGIKYPQAIWEEAEQRWISDAQVAEIPYTAFTSRKKAQHVTARLIVRRVKRLNTASVPAGQEQLFATHRHHAVFTDSPTSMLAAEASHRDHAIIEQVIADLKAGPLVHVPLLILSPRLGQSAELQGCVVDIVRDAAVAWLGSTRTDELLVVSSGRVAA